MSRSAPEARDNVVPHPSGIRGTLRTAVGRELSVRTYDRRGEDVVLVVLADVGGPPPAAELDPATLEYPSARGVIRLQGEAVFEDRSIVRFHAEGEPEITQRRAFVRVHAPREVTLDPPLAGGPLRAYTIDLSGGGMLLSGAPMLAEGDAVAFEMHVAADEEPIEGIARVVRVHDDGRRALAFAHIDEADRQRLIRFVFACLRAARARTRGDLV